MNLKEQLEKQPIKSSVPCRVDMGGTLDISTFFLPLVHAAPCTVNIALDLRTTVTLSPWQEKRVRISSRGFDTAEFETGCAPYTHPMGLMFAVVDFFQVHGVHIDIASSSPPRSALGGSSSAAVALAAALFAALGRQPDPAVTADLAHQVESCVAGVPCGRQDQLAAAFGGVHQWDWVMEQGRPAYRQNALLSDAGDPIHRSRFDEHILVAYCGRTHVSGDVNKRWVQQFLSGENRDKWVRIAALCRRFGRALSASDFETAAELMNQETRLRLEMTPDVLDPAGQALFESAEDKGWGGRFTGAGGGGCVWAIGPADDRKAVQDSWQTILNDVDQAALLHCCVDPNGILIH